ncbi:MAG: PIN domain-containing protein, partial [Parcubacteria group bacterium]|nr:PIN domain-containing protein [Parcubacteria group bacterium]
ILDTSFWIEIWKPPHQLSPKLKSQCDKVMEIFKDSLSYPCVNGIILAELLRGLSKTKKNQQRIAFLLQLRYLDIPKQTYIKAAALAQSLDQKGEKLSLPDCLIAAVTIENNLTLITKDRHFKRFPNLDLILLEE